MVHLLTWPRIRLVVRAATIYTPLRGRKHHFRWLLRWRNLPVRANPHGLLRLTAYLRFASCLSTPGWMCIGIEYRQTASSFLFTPPRNLLPVSMKLATWSIVPLLLRPLFLFFFFFFNLLLLVLLLLSPLSFSRPFLRFKIKKAFSARSFGVERGISAMLRLRWPASSRIWVTIQLQAVEGSRPTASFESTAFL